MTQPEEANLAELFDYWLEGKTLTSDQLASLKQAPLWSQRMAVHNEMLEMADNLSESVDVPKWRKDKGFDQYLAKPSWWQRQGTSLVALSFSIFACLIMLFDVRLVNTSNGQELVINDQSQQAWLEQQFVQLAEKNNEVINARMDDLSLKQQNDTAQLASYLVANSRLERKEDIEDVVRVIQQQRQDDMRYLRQQFSDVNYNIRLASQQNERNLRKSDYNDASEQQVTE
ncbi:hypothetical protein KO525_14775 [Psychrosphaera sp. B3R10]|uniref:hypothetical protein n=1 Tax=unclassified Psychrosphaera TaxID=2641570 RepID=UPI001C089869|nr:MULTISPECIES: hypothetical protein [unclassified Psychrosphaera]MBU2883255.1 hypothetical protein [Psychrosphaera sp. I2R16]MBU2990651.1 hypothetical protein [Psychrosphaera sp. B3R10]